MGNIYSYYKLSKNLDKVQLNTFNGLRLLVRIVEVYDGDTVTFICHYKGNYEKYKLRLYGIDTPEIKTRSINEKELGLKARDVLSEKILNKLVFVEFLKEEKYGRKLGTIYMADGLLKNKNGLNICQWLLDTGHAVAYFGEKKTNKF